MIGHIKKYTIRTYAHPMVNVAVTVRLQYVNNNISYEEEEERKHKYKNRQVVVCQ